MSDKWYHKAVVYQIYPRSFYDANGDGIGDLEGIIAKLDYLNDGTDKSLGVDAIWLSPIYPSPMADFGYDVSNYCDIHPMFGNLEIFDRLVDEAHKRNIKVIMDYIPNHTSDQHPWFLESRSSQNNPKRSWYIWKKSKPDGSPPNNWLSVFGGSGWEWDETTQSYYFHSFLNKQPDLNWRNPEVQEAMKNVLRFWLNRGVDGFRMDVVYHIYKDDEFRDNPPNINYLVGQHDPYWAQLHTYSHGLPETLQMLRQFCTVLHEYGDKFMVTEIHVTPEEMMKFFHICNPKLHSPFNFHLMSLPWDAQEYRKFIDFLNRELTEEDIPNYVLGNHDASRVVTRVGPDRGRLLALMLFTLRGMPFVYYGEELGMEDVEIPPELVQDPFEKNVPGMKLGRDPERTPMQWSADHNAGFSKVQPWLPISDKYKEINVEKELLDEHSMLSLYQQLIRLRKNHPTLMFGQYRSIQIDNSNIFAFEREDWQHKLIVLINFSDRPQPVRLDHSGEILIDIKLKRTKGQTIYLNDLTLEGYEGLVLQIN